MLRPSSTSPSCVELRASCFNSHASEQRLIRQPPQPPHQTPAVTPRPCSARLSPSSPTAGRKVRPATSGGGEGWARARARRSSVAAAVAKAQWPPPRAAVRGRGSHIASNTPSDACAWGEPGSGGSGAARPAAELGRRYSARRSSLGGESPLARRPTITCNAANDAAGYPTRTAGTAGVPQASALGRRRSARRASLGGESPLARRPAIVSAAGSGAHLSTDLGANGPLNGDGAEASPPQQDPNGNVSPAGAGAAAALQRRSAEGAAGRHGSVDSARDSWGLDERLSAGLARPGCSRPEVTLPLPLPLPLYPYPKL